MTKRMNLHDPTTRVEILYILGNGGNTVEMKQWKYGPKDGEELDRNQYDTIMKEIWENHRFAEGGRNIKYIDPHWDMRDGKCFAVQFRGLFGNGKIIFDGRQSERSMFDRIMEWLNGSNEVEADTE